MKKIISGLVLSLAVVFAAGCGERLAKCENAETAEICGKKTNFKDDAICHFEFKDATKTDADKKDMGKCLDKAAAEKVCTDAKKNNGNAPDDQADCDAAVAKIPTLKGTEEGKCVFANNACVIKTK